MKSFSFLFTNGVLQSTRMLSDECLIFHFLESGRIKIKG